MVRGGKKVEENGDERSRFKKLAISRKLVCQEPCKPHSVLMPSKTVMKHDGCDIVKKSQRKNRFLFSFPGLLAPITGGKMGELKDLGTKNPILYLDFPQGQIKLFGTIVYPKNRYLTLQFSKGGKSVICEDNFDNMIVFSDAWWIGKKDENPGEVRLEFPKHLTEGKLTDCDFKGGAGATSEQKLSPNDPGVTATFKQKLGVAGATSEQKLGPNNPGATATFKQKLSVNKPCREQDESHSPAAHLEDDVSEDSSPLSAKNKDVMELTPVRQSARTAGRTFRFAEASSGEDSVEDESDTFESMEDKVAEKSDDVMDDYGHAINSEDVAARVDLLEQNHQSSNSPKSKESSRRKRGPLIQATLSSLFQKVEEKKSTGSPRKSSTQKGTAQKSIGSRQKTNKLKDESPRKMGTPIKEKKSGNKSNTKKKRIQVEDDDIEECSSEWEDIDGSDGDWTA